MRCRTRRRALPRPRRALRRRFQRHGTRAARRRVEGRPAGDEPGGDRLRRDQLRRPHQGDGPRAADEPDALPEARSGAARSRRRRRDPARVGEGRLRGRGRRRDRAWRPADSARGGDGPRRRPDADERRDDARLPVPLAPVVRRQVLARLDPGRARGGDARRARRPRVAAADDDRERRGAPAGGDRRPRLRHPDADRRHLPGDRARLPAT